MSKEYLCVKNMCEPREYLCPQRISVRLRNISVGRRAACLKYICVPTENLCSGECLGA